MPVCVYNNTEGDEDARVLKAFGEPSWNNPVVRIVDTHKKNLVDRIHDEWTLKALSIAMVKALVKDNKEVPPYLNLLAEEETARKGGLETAIFGMG